MLHTPLQNPLYSPEDVSSTATHAFRDFVNRRHGLSLSSYNDLYTWSCSDIASFWKAVWDYDIPLLADIDATTDSAVVPQDATPSNIPSWFPGRTLNWAENMLTCRSKDSIALIQCTEPVIQQPAIPAKLISYAELYVLVADIVSALHTIPILPGDRVASYSSNCVENCAALLATSAVGAIWVGVASEFGPEGVVERLEQLKPRVIFFVDAVVYNGKIHSQRSKLKTVLSHLQAKGLPPVVSVMVESLLPQNITESLDSLFDFPLLTWREFVEMGSNSRLGRTAAGEIEWRRMPFDWPLWVLFSSGTTSQAVNRTLSPGKPKPIVHHAGGMLLQSKKELCICADIRSSDVFFYYTTTGWMMYNWLISGLLTRCTIVLYDGSPLKNPALLWDWVQELKISIFGTSAKYLDALSRLYRPIEHHDLTSLRHIYSTGSPLSPFLYDFVYEGVSQTALLASITGGSDICSLFAGMNSSLPVFRGEIQCRMLGMAICAISPEGALLGHGQSGEMVCTRPFPCQPLGLWPIGTFESIDSVSSAATRYHEAYFSQYPEIWCHGDHIVVTESQAENGGGVVMLGRSDGVLNPGGVRFGSAELYAVIEKCFSPSSATTPACIIVNCLAIGQLLLDGTDERVVLFIVLPEGRRLDDDLREAIRMEIRRKLTARHVPSRILQVDDIPETLNGKRVEVPIKKLINGSPLSSINPVNIKNPNCLESFALLGAQLRKEL